MNIKRYLSYHHLAMTNFGHIQGRSKLALPNFKLLQALQYPGPIHGTGRFIYIWLICMVNVGKYTSPMDAMGYELCPRHRQANLYQGDTLVAEILRMLSEEFLSVLHQAAVQIFPCLFFWRRISSKHHQNREN